MKNIFFTVCFTFFFISANAQDGKIVMTKNDPIAINSVIAYDISRAKGSIRGNGNRANDFRVLPDQVIHIEPVPKDSYGEGSYYIPIFMRGKKGDKIYASVIGTKKIKLLIDSFTVKKNGKDAYLIKINTQYCKTDKECPEKKNTFQCTNCKEDNIKFTGGQRLDIQVAFPWTELFIRDEEGNKNIAEGKICRGYTH